YGNLVAIPGERHQYSNLGYGVIDYAISRVSGKPYADFMREEVFVKLGLTRTSVDIGPGLKEFAATRYGSDGRPIPFYDFDHPGGSAIFSSAHDLVRFGMFHLKAHLDGQKAILTDATLDAMHKPTVKTGERGGYGIGWSSTERPDGYRVVAHAGGMGGVSTSLRLVESEKLAVVVLSPRRFSPRCGRAGRGRRPGRPSPRGSSGRDPSCWASGRARFPPIRPSCRWQSRSCRPATSTCASGIS
ncbi:MAG: beta-lactamase family protein, partial [Acidobacteria bacterium]|nr:beta-lactamase family protein [Acidobacteriota bacterium]